MGRPTSGPSWVLRLAAVTVLVGVSAGVSGVLVVLLLRLVQHVAYGYSEGSFLDGLLAGDPWRRVVVLAIAGVVGGFGWWALRHWGRPVVSIAESVAGRRMPALATTANAALQTVVVGLGASIGREVAPRELAALAAGWLSERAGISARERRILVACGAGAGLAAVYNVPLGGAVFAVEILLAELSFATALPALVTSAVATLVSQLLVPATTLYQLPAVTLSPSLVVWSAVTGPVIGFVAVGFVLLAQSAREHRPRNWNILVIMPVTFTAVGLIAVPFPSILGNGRSLGQIAFDGSAPVWMLLVLFLLKAFATSATIGAGAAGGTLTPSLALGAAFGAMSGGLWISFWPGSVGAAFAFVGAAAFLATTLRGPFTALVLVVEFTGQGPTLLIPTMLAVAGSVAVSYWLGRRRLTGFA